MPNGIIITVQSLGRDGNPVDPPHIFAWSAEAIELMESKAAAQKGPSAMAVIGHTTSKFVAAALTSNVILPQKKVILPDGN